MTTSTLSALMGRIQALRLTSSNSTSPLKRSSPKWAPSSMRSGMQVGPLNFTHGKDNAVGSTRSGTFDGTFFTERLVEYARSSSQLRLRFILDNGPILFSGVTFHSYSEEMEIMSICGGGATYISFTAVYCEDKVGNGYDFYDKIRRRAVGAVADQLKALAFAGSCPISKH
ncbi:hypothetical protein D9615_009516 [Tricholomella constricta]|uniref:Uncharacterized protein n=1 Tax=Tricholomella constricta TaxID=117010 RepID=A0A8H5GYQ5_9AGAR|nr:hypothetical protein D9615_009516 [Tricholomella constricta]